MVRGNCMKNNENDMIEIITQDSHEMNNRYHYNVASIKTGKK